MDMGAPCTELMPLIWSPFDYCCDLLLALLLALIQQRHRRINAGLRYNRYCMGRADTLDSKRAVTDRQNVNSKTI